VKVDQVIAQENIDITPDAIDALVKLSRGDMRRALNVLQACYASSAPLPPAKGAHLQITETDIYECIAAPHPDDIQTIVETLLEKADVVSCLTTINNLKANKGLALADILTAVADELTKLEVKPASRVTWLDGLSEIEWRLAGGGAESIQTGAVIGVVRKGVDLSE
jgi:replication factor C subunit 3/5